MLSAIAVADNYIPAASIKLHDMVCKLKMQSYLMEAVGLAGFVLGAGLLSIFLEHPDLPAMKSWLKDYPALRRVPLGIIMGAYISAVILLFGKKSGAHINPSVTWTFYRLNKMSVSNAWLYTIAQFIGASAAALLLKLTLGEWFGHEKIGYGVTKPTPPHTTMEAFFAEFIISFILMLITLFTITSKRREEHIALISGIIIGLYLIVEIPFSGMSLNPARSFAGSLAANKWEHLWLYFIAPPLAMLLAAEVFLRCKKRQLLTPINNNETDTQLQKNLEDYEEIPVYPVEKKPED
jgi:aquaporin Z